MSCLRSLRHAEEAAASQDWAAVRQYSTEGLSPKGGACSSSAAIQGALYLWQGRALLYHDQAEEALKALHRAAHYLAIDHAPDSLLAELDIDRADAFVILDQYDSLVHYFTVGIDRAESAPHVVPTQRLALACNNLGYHLGLRQTYNLATRYYQKAIHYWRQLPDTDTADLSAAYFNLGSIKPGPSGIDYLHEALALNQATQRPSFAPRALLGSKLQALGRHPQALHYYQLAIAELDTLLRTDAASRYRYDFINTLSLRASLHRARGAWSDAHSDLVRALKITEGSSGFSHSRIKLRTDLAEVLALQSGTVAAIPVLERVLTDAARDSSYLFGYPAYNLAAHHAALGHDRRAVQYAQLSLRHAAFGDFDLSLPDTPEDFSQQSLPLNANYATLLTCYAQYLQRLPAYQSLAQPHFEAAMRLYEQCLRAYPEDIYTWQKYREAALAYQEHLAQSTDLHAAFAASEKAKLGRAQRAFAWQITPITDAKMASAFAEWRALQYQITDLREQLYYMERDPRNASDTTPPDLQRHVFQLQQSLDAAIDSLEAIAPAFAAAQLPTAPISIAALQATLTDSTAFLSYSIVAQTLHRYTVTRSGFVHEAQPLSSDFGKRLDRFQRLLHHYDRDSLATLYAQAQRFYRLLLPHDLPTSVRHLIVAPDPTFYTLPFDALCTDADSLTPHFLVHRYRVSYASSATLWTQQQRTPSRPQAKFWAGYVPFYRDTPAELPDTLTNTHLAAIIRAGHWALPGAQQEGAAIARLTKGDLWQGAKATEAHFKAHAADYQVLHLAMHASLNETHPLYSKLHFQHTTPSDATQDLTIAELYTQQYRADLVVLSACHTGVGTHTESQGLVSLSSAFTAAGCPSTVMSLWQVPDATTSPIMIAFYHYLRQGMDKAAALQAAKREYLSQVTASGQMHPFFWSGMVLNGNHNPISFPQRHPWPSGLWWMLVAFVGLVVAVWRYSRVRSRNS